MRRARTAGWAIGIVRVISTSVAHGQSTGEASVRLNGVPVIQVTASGNESATARAARIERRLERLADRVDETASPAVSGVLILGLRPFQMGDEIVVGETEGSVQRIRLRATEIKTYDGRLVLVPNAELFTSRVRNNTAAPVRRTSVEVPVAHGTDLAGAERALLFTAESVAEVLAAPAPSERVRLLGAADIVLELRFRTDSRRADLLATTSVVRRRVVQAFSDAGLPLPEPDLHRVELHSNRSA